MRSLSRVASSCTQFRAWGLERAGSLELTVGAVLKGYGFLQSFAPGVGALWSRA